MTGLLRAAKTLDMSYDFRLGADRTPFYDGNYTSNIYAIWSAASDGGDMVNLDGLYGWQAAAVIARTLVKLRAEPARFRALEPTNGWGSYAGFISFLENLRSVCAAHPRARLHVSA